MIDHVVYLANTSGLKVGITRGQPGAYPLDGPGRDPGAAIFRVDTRLHSGLVETVFKDHMADKTNWQAMLKGDAEPVDLEAERQRLMAECAARCRGPCSSSACNPSRNCRRSRNADQLSGTGVPR